MEPVPYVQRDVYPDMRLRIEILDEGHCMEEAERIGVLIASAAQRKREADETKKIIAAIEKEKHDAFVEKKRRIELIKNAVELRTLQSYLMVANSARSTIEQLKMEDAKIDQRFVEEAEQVKEIRAGYRAMEEHHRQAELQKKREAEKLCQTLKSQIAEHEAQRVEARNESLREGLELREKINKLNEKDRKDAQAAAMIRRQSLRMVEAKSKHSKHGASKQDLYDFYAADDEKIAKKKYIDDARKNRLKRQQDIAYTIGTQNLAKEQARKNALTNLIEYWAIEKELKNNALYEQECEQQNETRRELQRNMKLQEDHRHTMQQRELDRTHELCLKRLKESREERDKMIEQKKRIKRERWENDQYVKMVNKRLEEVKALDAIVPNTQIWEIEQQKQSKEIEELRIELLKEQPISLLRYLPASIVRSEYLPDSLRDKIIEEVKRTPIPMLNKKRRSPHIVRQKLQGGELTKCCKIDPPRWISNVM